MNNKRLTKLKKDDYLTKGYDFWKSYREKLTEIIKCESKVEKTPENINKLSNEIGVKATARYFNLQPSQVRYYRKKFENTKE